MGYIYKITNILNNYFYIGQTKNSVNKRLNSHISNAFKRNKHNNKFYNAIEKYGKDNFKIEIIKQIEDLKLDEYEIYYIQKLNPHYNSSEGGKSTKGFSGKKLSLKHKANLIKNNFKIIYQYDLEGNYLNSYKSIKSASEILNVSRTSISHNLNGKQKTAFGFIWIFKFLGSKIDVSNLKHGKSKSILQMDINNNIIKIWDSMVDIEKELNISSGKICMCCKGKRKTTGGFKFEYYEK